MKRTFRALSVVFLMSLLLPSCSKEQEYGSDYYSPGTYQTYDSWPYYVQYSESFPYVQENPEIVARMWVNVKEQTPYFDYTGYSWGRAYCKVIGMEWGDPENPEKITEVAFMKYFFKCDTAEYKLGTGTYLCRPRMCAYVVDDESDIAKLNLTEGTALITQDGASRQTQSISSFFSYLYSDKIDGISTWDVRIDSGWFGSKSYTGIDFGKH